MAASSNIPDEGDVCPYCAHLNAPPFEDLCAHAVAWVWDGQTDALGNGIPLASALKKLVRLVQSAGRQSPLNVMLQVQAKRNPARNHLIRLAALECGDMLTALLKPTIGTGWATSGMLSGWGSVLYTEAPHEVTDWMAECHAILKACRLDIKTQISAGGYLGVSQSMNTIDWTFVVSGYWQEGRYHSGHVAYFIANPEPGRWVMEARERRAVLDGLDQEDIDSGFLNDDQIQALWGTTLEEASRAELRSVVAVCDVDDTACTINEMALMLYRAVCESGGKTITEPDDVSGILQL